MVIKYPKSPKDIPSGHKIYNHFPIYGPAKFTQIGIFGLKTNNLATLALEPALLTEFAAGINSPIF
jgi:hypothetical protein